MQDPMDAQRPKPSEPSSSGGSKLSGLCPKCQVERDEWCDLWNQSYSLGCRFPVAIPMYDSVNHPKHYTQHPSGVECIQITEHFNFNLGNAIKYIWRAGEKDNLVEDLRKAQWYLNREIERLSK